MKDTSGSGLLMAPRRNDLRLRRPRRFAWRMATARLRALPSFFIVGAMKSGTSSLFAHLCEHRLVVPPFRKETHYFGAGLRAGRSLAWYRAHFPLRQAMPQEAITGEATPGYGYEEEAAGAIRALVPDARIIFILRNPVERAISHYFHEVRMGRETLPIAEAMRLEEERLAAARAAGARGTETLLHANYAARGHYHLEVERYRSLFGKKQVLVLGSRELFDRPADCVARTAEFLGLPAERRGGTYPARNKGSNKSDVPAGVRASLEEHFAPHNERLWQLLGFKPDW